MDTLLDLEKWGETAPESSALLAPGRPALGYLALWKRILAVRRELTGAGVTAGRPVALVFPDGPDFVVTLLAAAELAPCGLLDPAASSEEYQFYFSRLRAPVLATLEGCSPAAVAAAEAQGMTVVPLPFQPDYALAPVTSTRGTKREWEPRVTGAALLLFTSSTTGRPKLVPHTGENLEAACRNETAALELSRQDRLLSLIPLSSGRGIRAILAQLRLGASVICAPRFDPGGFPEWLTEFQPTWIAAPAAALGVMCSQARQRPDLWRHTRTRFVRSGSTVPDPQLVREFEELTGVPVLDGYGVTEAAGVTRSTPRARKPGSVGRSSGTTIAILDEAGRPLGPGLPGEIALRGPAVMSGYLEDEEANRRAFRDGWYCTGDLGYLDDEGFLFLTGRLAEVINRGGQKIIPQQVEEVLKTHPAVAEAAVFGVPHKTLGAEVAAAVVTGAGGVSELELRQFTAARLSTYKVPRRILFLERLPRNAAGKVRRKHLSDRYQELAELEKDQAEILSTETERLLAALWTEEFGSHLIGRDADFFRLGGDSLTAAVMAARIQDSFGIVLDLRTFAEHPRLKDLAEVVDDLRQGRVEAPRPIERAQRNAPLPLSFPQERIWKYSFPTPPVDGLCPVNYNVAFAHRLCGPLDIGVLRLAMTHLAERHEILRTTFEPSQGLAVQVVHSATACELAEVDFSHLPAPERQARLLLEQEASKPLHFAQAPLARFILARLRPREHWLIRVNHHLISDSQSWKIYFRELGAVYEDLLQGRTPRIPSMQSASYADYASWQRRELSPARPSVRQAIDWWAALFSRLAAPSRTAFSTAVNRLSPSRRREAASIAPSDGLLTWGLDRATTERLRQLQSAEGITHYQLRAAAFTALVASMTGQREVIAGSYFNFRSRLEWQTVMGDFTNLVTLPLIADETLSFRELARSVRRQMAEISAQAEIPYEVLRGELQARGVIPPPIDVLFYTSDHSDALRWGEVEMTWAVRAVPTIPWGFSLAMDTHNEDRLCYAIFDSRLYAPEAVRAFVARFIRLLDAASRQPDLTLERLLADHC